jgi:hypothetical protein
MHKLWLAALAASTAFVAAPALADRYYHYNNDGYISQREAAWSAQERTRIRQERNSERVYAETRRRQAASNYRLRREAIERQRGTYDHAYYDDAAYERGRRDAEREFRRFADRNRDGQVSRREYEWAMARW